MDKESTYQLQCIDCNCNDCIFMQRNVDRYVKSLDRHKEWQLNDFNGKVSRLNQAAYEWLEKYEPAKADKIFEEAAKMRFQFNKNTAMINYGTCAKFSKPVSFIPNTLQLQTQSCFQHRKD